MKKELAIIMCPPLVDFKQPPTDISKCKLEECPHCHQAMWFSDKKREMKKFCGILQKEIFFGCYHCVMEFIEDEQQKDLNFKTDVKRIDI